LSSSSEDDDGEGGSSKEQEEQGLQFPHLIEIVPPIVVRYQKDGGDWCEFACNNFDRSVLAEFSFIPRPFVFHKNRVFYLDEKIPTGKRGRLVEFAEKDLKIFISKVFLRSKIETSEISLTFIPSTW